MQVWLFESTGRLKALTTSELGSNLPDDLGSWSCVRLVELTGDYDDEKEAIELISEHGFCCFE